jgi:hypothetical protein
MSSVTAVFANVGRSTARKPAGALSAAAVDAATFSGAPCLLEDGAGLFLLIASPRVKRWVFIVHAADGRETRIPLGAAARHSLQQARAWAQHMRARAAAGGLDAQLTAHAARRSANATAANVIRHGRAKVHQSEGV